MDDQAAGRAWQRGAMPPSRMQHRQRAPRAYGWSAHGGPATVAMLLRHGETPLSVESASADVTTCALTDRGEAQAAAAARRLRTAESTSIVSSPLRRTRQTATIVAAALGLDVTTDDGFAETDFGEWEGSSFAELTDRPRPAARLARRPDGRAARRREHRRGRRPGRRGA